MVDNREFINLIKIAVKEVLDEMQPTIKESATLTKPVTTKELCDFLRITEPTVMRWKKKGKIPYMNIGTAVRFDLYKVLAALEK